MKRWIGMAAALVLSLGMTGCGAGKAQEPAAEQTEAVTVDLEEIRQAVQDAYGESYIPSAPYDAETFAALFGITEDMWNLQAHPGLYMRRQTGRSERSVLYALSLPPSGSSLACTTPTGRRFTRGTY